MRDRLAAALPHEPVGLSSLPRLFGTCTAQNGYLFNKEAKAGFSGQNRASRGRSVVWAATLGSKRGISLPGTQSLWSSWM